MWRHRTESETYRIDVTGGSVRIMDKRTGELLREHKGYTYLYTGEIRPDEKEFFALENGKHFYVFSLESFEMCKRVTLPRGYEAIDVYGFYSEDGKMLNIPAERYVYDDKIAQNGHYEYVLCKYETAEYSLIEKIGVENKRKYRWSITECESILQSGMNQKDVCRECKMHKEKE